jgi:cytochrome P450
MSAVRLVPGPFTRSLAGFGKRMQFDRLNFLMEVTRDYGDLVRFRVWNQDIYLVSNPDFVKEILVTQHRNFHKSRALKLAKYILGEGLLTSEDDFHKRQRRMMQPPPARAGLRANHGGLRRATRRSVGVDGA